MHFRNLRNSATSQKEGLRAADIANELGFSVLFQWLGGRSEQIRGGARDNANILVYRASNRSDYDASNYHASCDPGDPRQPTRSARSRQRIQAQQELSISFSFLF